MQKIFAKIIEKLKEAQDRAVKMDGDISIGATGAFGEAIKIVKQAETECKDDNGWIPVSERLPSAEDCQRYDVFTKEPVGIFWVTILQNRSGLTYTTKMCYRPERGIWYRNGSEMNQRSGWTGHRIVAWMPMDIPKPYQMNEQMVRDREKENWLKFYMTFNDDNRCHAEEAFESNGLEEAFWDTLIEENREWYKEVLSHGISEEEICKSMPEAAEYAPRK